MGFIPYLLSLPATLDRELQILAAARLGGDLPDCVLSKFSFGLTHALPQSVWHGMGAVWGGVVKYTLHITMMQTTVLVPRMRTNTRLLHHRCKFLQSTLSTCNLRHHPFMVERNRTEQHEGTLSCSRMQ